jgi:hypothetical protein
VIVYFADRFFSFVLLPELSCRSLEHGVVLWDQVTEKKDQNKEEEKKKLI